VRVALSSEKNELEQLQLRASLNNPGDREAILANPDAIALSPEHITDGRVFVAEVDNSIKAFATILPREDGDVDLDALFVDPESLRQGLGRKLIDHCIQVARNMGSDIIHVIGNPHADDFYTACGFETTGTEKTQFGTGLLMRKQIIKCTSNI
jgi:GNAT superfamily N-acetyltransferase